ncbi:MAG: N-acetylmuramoyl-L-alanine amidase [Bacillota bacterium]
MGLASRSSSKCLILLVLTSMAVAVAIACATAHAAASAAGQAPVRVLAVNCAEMDGRTTITVALTGKATYTSFVLKEPDRLVVDIDGAILPSQREPITVGDGVVNKVRIAQFNHTVVRVVVDLVRSSACTVNQPEDRPDQIVIAFPQRVTGVEFHDVHGRAGATIKGTGKLRYRTSILVNPARIVVDLPDTVLASDTAPMPVSHEIVRQIRASQHSPDTVRVVMDLSRTTTYSVFTSSDRPGEVVVDLGYRIKGATFTTGVRSTTVSVKSSGRPQMKFTRLSEPHRIVLDFEDSVLDAPDCTIPVGDGTVERIRLAQFGPMTVRVVLDLPYYIGHSLISDSTSSEVSVEVARSSVYKKTLVIDPGHGGADPGAIGPTGLQEKAVTLDISKLIGTMLQDAGARAVLTRTDDVSVFLPERVRIANEARADAFVSVHANAGKSEIPAGTETLYSTNVPMSRRLAEHVQSNLVKEIGLADRGIRERPDLYVIRETKMPSCLVEVVFMSNLAEELLLMDEDFRKKAARGITNGILGYFQWRMEAESGGAEAPSAPAAPAAPPASPAPASNPQDSASPGPAPSGAQPSAAPAAPDASGSPPR